MPSHSRGAKAERPRWLKKSPSKEELQSLNEELTALNNQLQETLERQRTTSNDLQNVLYSTDVATIFLDTRLQYPLLHAGHQVALQRHSRAMSGRPLADLNSLAADGALLTDARAVLRSIGRIEREIEAQSGAWYHPPHPALPHAGQRRSKASSSPSPTSPSAGASRTRWRRPSGRRNWPTPRSRAFSPPPAMICASRCKRSRCFRGCWRRAVEGEQAQQAGRAARRDAGRHVGHAERAARHQPDRGRRGPRRNGRRSRSTICLMRLRDEFDLSRAGAKASPCAWSRAACRFDSDPRLLEQMIRNLLSNALKYTKRGKVLLGCRRRDGILSIEVWDTGIGIPDDGASGDLRGIPSARTMRRASAAAALASVCPSCSAWANLLGHRVRVRSRAGQGLGLRDRGPAAAGCGDVGAWRSAVVRTTAPDGRRRRAPARSWSSRTIPKLRELLELFLKEEGHRRGDGASTAPTALQLVERGDVRPDLILADYNLPNGMNGLQVAAKLRQELRSANSRSSF